MPWQSKPLRLNHNHYNLYKDDLNLYDPLACHTACGPTLEVLLQLCCSSVAAVAASMREQEPLVLGDCLCVGTAIFSKIKN